MQNTNNSINNREHEPDITEQTAGKIQKHITRFLIAFVLSVILVVIIAITYR